MQEEVGYPFTLYNPKSFSYGGGGIAGWGSLCGTLAVAAQFIALFHEDANPLISELMAWYSQAEFPMYQPEMELPQTVADSTLCHVSVSKFMSESGFAKSSDERKKRCAGVTADVVKFTVELLNAAADGSFEAKYGPAPIVDECISCHSGDVQGQEDCSSCHEDPH